MSRDAPEAGVTFLARGERLRRSWRVPIASALAVVACAAVGTTSGPLAVVACGLIPSLVLLGAVSLARNSFPRAAPVALAASARGLALDGGPLIAADAIAEARQTTGERGLPEVRLTLRDGRLVWLRLSPSDASRLLHTLGVGAGERRASFALQSAFSSRLLVVFALLALHHVATRGLGGPGAALGLLVMVNLVVSSALAWLVGVVVRGRAIIGADGITVRWPLLPDRFVPFAGVASVEAVSNALRRDALDTLVRLHGGRSLRLIARDAPTNEAQRGAEPRALFHHVIDALARSRQHEPAGASLDALVAPTHRSSADWLASLDDLGRNLGGRYRVAAPTTERLAEVVTNPALPAAARAGAATALLRRGDEDSRRAVRVATDGCAEPALREALLALEQAADDETFIMALDRLDRR